MPGGSVIGCPKIRTLELLNKQETEDRNIFTGSFGYIKFNQDMRFNIIIRSILNFKNSIKETKEHNMIVDMERSDLSRICKPGTVKILKKKYVEEYKHLFHYVTTIQGKLRNKIKIKNIIKSMMPGGSVIGCPKIRTLELLNKQENEDRNIFTGSFGYIKFNQDMRFNIIIRSILNFKNISEISAASGIVLESSSKKEFNENFIKAKSLLDLYK